MTEHVICTRRRLRQLTGTTDPQEQTEILRKRGLNPYVHPKSGRPIIYESAILQSMVDSSNSGFTLNEKAFA